MKHYLITEWNVDMFDLEWLQARQILFEKYTLPSVQAQLNIDFTSILVSDTRTPDVFKEVLDGYPAEVLYYNFENFDWGDPAPSMKEGSVMKRSIELEYIHRPLAEYIGTPDTDYIITSRLDNDDAISVDHIDRIQTIAKQQRNGDERFWLNLSRGYKLRLPEEEAYPINAGNNPFLSFVEPPFDIKTTYQVCHTAARQHTDYRLCNIRAGAPTWLQVVHGANLLNRMTSVRYSVPFSDLNKRFITNA